MPHKTAPRKAAPKRANKPWTKPTSSKHHRHSPISKSPPAKRRCTSCPDCKTAKLTTIAIPGAEQEHLPDGRVKLAGYEACSAGCGYLAQQIRNPKTGRCVLVAVPDRLAERWSAVELCAALGVEPGPDDYEGCYVGEVCENVQFREIYWDPPAVEGEGLSCVLPVPLCETLGDAIDGTLELRLSEGDLLSGEGLLEDTQPAGFFRSGVFDDEPLSPRTTPVGFERTAVNVMG